MKRQAETYGENFDDEGDDLGDEGAKRAAEIDVEGEDGGNGELDACSNVMAGTMGIMVAICSTRRGVSAGRVNRKAMMRTYREARCRCRGRNQV